MEHDSRNPDPKPHSTAHAVSPPSGGAGHASHYWRLAMMLLVSFVAMYVLMYAMVDVANNAVPNVNQAYMAGLMTGPMVMIELLLMRSMFAKRRLNAVILGASAIVSVVCFALIRKQGAVGDTQFLRSMIPHHSAAILMCREAQIADPEIKRLCESIRASQQAEIDQMRRKLGK